MARLFILFDPSDRIKPMGAEVCEATGSRQALLDLPEGIADRDIYEIARKLAELLLEQLS